MAKYYGTVGYGVDTETDVPGVWRQDINITEKQYYGEVLSNNRRWQQGENLNDNLTVSNSISILADPYAFENFHNIRYITWMGIKWKVTSIDVQYPRLIMTLGGEYNGE